MSKRIVITVDGLAGSGKTTLSRLLAERINAVHLSTGILYRAVGLLALREGINLEDGAALAKLIGSHELALRIGESSAMLLVDGRDMSSELYAPEVSDATSKTAQHREVRSALVDIQREAFPGKTLVAEGRDMGTVIFPEAGAKFFVQANEEIRAQRRIAQLLEGSAVHSEAELNSLKEKMKVEITERDRRDSVRELSPTKPAVNAILIDNSAQPLTKVVQSMYDALIRRGVIVSTGA